MRLRFIQFAIQPQSAFLSTLEKAVRWAAFRGNDQARVIADNVNVSQPLEPLS